MQKKRELVKDLVAGRKSVGEVMAETFSPLVIMCRDGGFLVHKVGNYTEEGGFIRDYYSASEFKKIEPFFSAIIYLPEKNLE